MSRRRGRSHHQSWSAPSFTASAILARRATITRCRPCGQAARIFSNLSSSAAAASLRLRAGGCRVVSGPLQTPSRHRIRPWLPGPSHGPGCPSLHRLRCKREAGGSACAPRCQTDSRCIHSRRASSLPGLAKPGTSLDLYRFCTEIPSSGPDLRGNQTCVSAAVFTSP